MMPPRFTGDVRSWRMAQAKRLLVIGFFALLVILGFKGLSWTAKGAPGAQYLIYLRRPTALMIAIGWTGLIFAVLPHVIELDAHVTVAPDPHFYTMMEN